MDLNQPFNSPTGIHFNHPFNTPTGRISNKLPSQRYLQHKLNIFHKEQMFNVYIDGRKFLIQIL
ncbi:hypothetical protein ZOSMA_1033G00010 [Zostera marina]|uniref:Uncharacterized protein n=1 Tax=Zostera marina TaxID=29655 RepID=A0A0K9Q6C6_ZOSMR|nr:hypothetical protein ZOSMA_1033G00010 [Zostera marina]